ncbi:MAG: hypothetical protein SGPRY_011244 [Prymnesium sp.]
MASRLARRALEVRGFRLEVAQHFFDSPVAQPRRIPRTADLTGMKVWPTTLRLLERMESSLLPRLRSLASSSGRRVRVLELGSGTGIGGLAVALSLADACSVVLTDPDIPLNYAEGQPGFLRTNVEVNRKTIRQAGAGVEVMALEWGNQSHADAIRKACLASGEEFDLVLGSELLYDADNYSSLLHVLSQFVRGAVGATEERQGEGVDGGEQERVNGKAVDTDGTIAVLSYTHRSGSEARFLSEAAKRFQISTQEFIRTDQNPAWALSTLRPLSRQPVPPALSPHITPLSRLSGQTIPPLRRHLCSRASPDTSASPNHPSPSPAPSPAQIDGAIKPPLHLAVEKQVDLALTDEVQRGRKALSLPRACHGREGKLHSWGEYLIERGWGEENDLSDRLLLQARLNLAQIHPPQSITAALTCPLTIYHATSELGLTSRPSLLLHIVGAAETNEGALLSSGWVWEELSQLLPTTALHLALVGPAMREGGRGKSKPLRLTSRLTAEIAREEYSSWRGEAGSWGAAATPDLAFAFNSGCGTDQDAWAGAIDQLLHEGTPSASHCTAYSTHLIRTLAHAQRIYYNSTTASPNTTINTHGQTTQHAPHNQTRYHTLNTPQHTTST